MFRFIFVVPMIFSLAMAQNEVQTNKEFWHSMPTTADAGDIWKVWMDVPNWKNWDTGLQDADLEGAMKLGAVGSITSLEGRKVKFKVVAFEQGKSYTYKSNLPLGGLYVKRYLEEKNGQTYFTHRVWFKGLTAGIFAKQFGPKFREMLPGVLENINEIAQKTDRSK